MSKAITPVTDENNNKRYILQHIYTLEYVTKQTKGFIRRAEYSFTKVRSEAHHFTNKEAVGLIAVTAEISENEENPSVLETLRAEEV